MRKVILAIAIMMYAALMFGQDKMLVHTPDGMVEVLISGTDSLYFTEDGTVANFSVNGNIQQYFISDIDSITFDIAIDTAVFVTFSIGDQSTGITWRFG